MSKELMKLALEALDGGHVDRAYGYIQEALVKGEDHMNQKQIAAEQVQYTGNGTAGRQDMTAPTGFWIKHNDKERRTHD